MARSLTRILALAFALVTWATSAYAHYQAKNQVSVGTHLLFSPLESCRGNLDVVSCYAFRATLGVDATAQLRVLPWLALGLHGAWSGRTSIDVPVDVDQTQSLWRFSAQARFSPEVWLTGMWFAVEGGGAFMVESFDASDSGRRPRVHARTTQVAPLAAAALGWDWIMASHLSIGAEVRGVWTPFGTHPPRVAADVRADQLGSIFWLSTGMRLGVAF